MATGVSVCCVFHKHLAISPKVDKKFAMERILNRTTSTNSRFAQSSVTVTALLAAHNKTKAKLSMLLLHPHNNNNRTTAHLMMDEMVYITAKKQRSRAVCDECTAQTSTTLGLLEMAQPIQELDTTQQGEHHTESLMMYM